MPGAMMKEVKCILGSRGRALHRNPGQGLSRGVSQGKGEKLKLTDLSTNECHSLNTYKSRTPNMPTPFSLRHILI